MRSMRNVKRNAMKVLGMLILTLATVGSSCAIRHNFPVLEPPQPPRGIFQREGDRYFITKPNLQKLNNYIDDLLDQNAKYRRAIEIINGE